MYLPRQRLRSRNNIHDHILTVLSCPDRIIQSAHTGGDNYRKAVDGCQTIVPLTKSGQTVQPSDRRDLTAMGSFLFMGLIGIVIAMVVNIFLKSAMMDFVVSCLGVLIFTGLTAYDTQKLRRFGESAPLDDATAVRRGAILGALTLYLDFINLFLMLLRLFGGNRN